jgi:hypothetical protein
MRRKLDPGTELVLSAHPLNGGPPVSVKRKLANRLVMGRGIRSVLPLEDLAVAREQVSFELREGELWVTSLAPGAGIGRRAFRPGTAIRVASPLSISIPGYLLSLESPGFATADVYQPPKAFAGLTVPEWLTVANALAFLGVAMVYFAFV